MRAAFLRSKSNVPLWALNIGARYRKLSPDSEEFGTVQSNKYESLIRLTILHSVLVRCGVHYGRHLTAPRSNLEL